MHTKKPEKESSIQQHISQTNKQENSETRTQDTLIDYTLHTQINKAVR